MRLLVDNNIQIYRTMSVEWLNNKCDQIFSHVEPILTDYVLMEYRRTAILGIKLLCHLVDDMPQGSDNKMLRVRLSDVLADLLVEIGSPSKRYVTTRQIRLTVQILGFYLKQNPESLDNLSPKGFTEHLTFWAEELEDYFFYIYRYGTEIKDVRDSGGYCAVFGCSLSKKNDGYFCKTGKFDCKITEILDSEGYRRIANEILDGDAGIYDELEDNHLNLRFDPQSAGKSIGRRCFQISDILHASSCIALKVGLLTADKELAKLTNKLGIPTCTYSKKDSSFKGP